MYEVETEDTFNFKFLPCHSPSLSFSVKGIRDASIGLATQPDDGHVMYELVIGMSWNTLTAIKKQGWVKTQTKLSLSENNFTDYWIKWDNGEVRFGVQGRDNPILTYADKDIPNTKFFGIRTCWGSKGSWKIVDDAIGASGLRWVSDSFGDVPKGAIISGFEDGGPLYIGRSHFDRWKILQVGKVNPFHNGIDITQGEVEVKHEDYDVLCSLKPKWVTIKEKQELPEEALIAGFTGEGVPLYIGRAQHKMAITIGEVHPTKGLNLPYTTESVFPYQVLVVPRKQVHEDTKQSGEKVPGGDDEKPDHPEDPKEGDKVPQKDEPSTKKEDTTPESEKAPPKKDEGATRKRKK